MNREMYNRIAAELESARAEFNSLGRYDSASRTERAANRLRAAEEAWRQLRAA